MANLSNKYLTTQQAARVLGVSIRTIQQWVEKGRFKSWRTTGGHRRICSESVDQLHSERESQEAAPSHQPALRILVVEDNESLLRLYRLRISTWPIPVSIASAANGYEALVMIGDTSPDLMVCDLKLPGISGFQIIRASDQMERFRNMRIVVVSGLTDREIEAHGGFLKPIDVLRKPVDFRRLQEIGLATWSEIKYASGGSPTH